MPTSDELEAFHERLREIDKALAKLGSTAEVRNPELLSELSDLAKDWLKYSGGFQGIETFKPGVIQSFDQTMQAVLESTTNNRTRASTYRLKLKPVISEFLDSVVVPMIRHEGSPAQVAARQLLAAFTSQISPEESAYIEEAARCLAAKCHRAAMVMLWAAGIARLHGAIERVGFNTYNNALTTSIGKKGFPYNTVSKSTIGSLPELQRSRDFDILVVGMELWKYDYQVFEELNRLLGIRNSAAHPGMLAPSALDVTQFASKLNDSLLARVTN